MSGSGKGMRLQHAEPEVDLVPLIDCVFLLLLFFMLCGHISSSQRAEQITVPPTKTAQIMEKQPGWDNLVVNVYGRTTNDPRRTMPAYQKIWVLGRPPWEAKGDNDYSAYIGLRTFLDNVYDKSDKYDDPTKGPDGKTTGVILPKVVVELRADADTEYRVVQEVQQILSGTIDPATMLPRAIPMNQLKCFVHVNFTTRAPGDK